MISIPVQPDLFGGPSELEDFHVVTAHTRQLADGTEVFVGEHLRWNRGTGRAPRPHGAPGPAPETDQIALFPRRDP